MNETNIYEAEQKFSFKIYPNPAVDNLIVKIKNPKNGKFLLVLVNNICVVVYSEGVINEKTVNISHFSPGVYFVILNNNNIYKKEKIIIMK